MRSSADRFRSRSFASSGASSCAGDGRVSRPPVVCADCGGAGARRWMRGHMVFMRTCEACEGTGHLSVQACRTCGGVGTQPRS
jgi:molecular chaperone DnaJ